MHGSDGLDGMVKSVASLSAVARDLPVLHPGEGVLDTGSHPSVFSVVLLLPAQEGATGSLAVRDDQAGAEVGAVRDDRRARRQGGQVRLAPDMCVGLAAWRRPGRRDDQASVRVVMTCTFAENR